jgi:hypothetical protein
VKLADLDVLLSCDRDFGRFKGCAGRIRWLSLLAGRCVTVVLVPLYCCPESVGER